MRSPDLVARIIEFLRHEIPGAPAELSPSTSLVRSGLLDSVGLVRLAAFVENETGIVIPDRDVSAEHFDSIAQLIEYLVRREANP